MESTFKGVATNLTEPYLKDYEQTPLAEGYVRVKVHSVPVNPSDYYMTLGAYGIRSMYRS